MGVIFFVNLLTFAQSSVLLHTVKISEISVKAFSLKCRGTEMPKSIKQGQSPACAWALPLFVP